MSAIEHHTLRQTALGIALSAYVVLAPAPAQAEPPAAAQAEPPAAAQAEPPAAASAEPSATTAPASRPAGPTSRPAGDVAQLRREVKALRGALRRFERDQQATRRLVEGQETLLAEQGSPEPGERKFSVYGFFDVNYQRIWSSGTLRKLAIDAESSFIFGNLNTYFDFQPLPSWRLLAEVRFLLNPLGDTAQLENPLTGERFETVTTGTAEATFPLDRFDYGSIEIERAALTWSRLEWLTVSAGLFLTPYGIWNIDHGSPTRLQAGTPLLYALGPDNPFPERQLGLLVHGSFLLGGLTLTYDATLSNGRGPIQTLEDADEDKAVGGRLTLGSDAAPVRWKLGLSAYTGLNSDFSKRIDPQSGGIARDITVSFRETALGADLSLTHAWFGLQAEVLANWRRYRDGKRPPATRFFGQLREGGLAADRLFWGAYGLLWGRLPLPIDLRPYAAVYWIDPDDNYEDEALAVTAGLNWRIRGAVVLKLQYDLADTDLGRIQQLLSQLAVAF